jgi:SAM-dependent methyltransferase
LDVSKHDDHEGTTITKKRVGSLRVLRVFVAFVAVGVATSAQAPQAPKKPPVSKQRSGLFAPLDLGLLDAPDRDQWQKPDQIMDALQIADGSIVADLGAGGGWFTLRLARRVGPRGRVYAEDIQPQMIERISRLVARETLTNVTTVLGTTTDPRLPTSVDAALIVDSYREMELENGQRRDPVALLKTVADALTPAGRLGIVDFTPGGGGPGPAAEDRPDPNAIVRACAAAGLRLIRREEVPPFVYLLIFGRATATRSTP